MKQFNIKLMVEPNGRILSQMVFLFNKYDSDIRISKNKLERYVDGKSLLGIYSLSPHFADDLKISLFGDYERNDSIDLQDQLKFLMMKY